MAVQRATMVVFVSPFFSTYEDCSVTLAHWNVPKIVMVLVMLLLFCCQSTTLFYCSSSCRLHLSNKIILNLLNGVYWLEHGFLYPNDFLLGTAMQKRFVIKECCGFCLHFKHFFQPPFQACCQNEWASKYPQLLSTEMMTRAFCSAFLNQAATIK